MDSKGQLKCHRCKVCNGYGCPGNMPGLGGVFENKNFQLNFEGWKTLFNQLSSEEQKKVQQIKVDGSAVRCGPVTGAVENIGYNREEDFYLPYLKSTLQAGYGLCVGDGCPDVKLKLGIEAVKTLETKAAFFLKPYPQEKLFERIEWVKPYASYIGIDIDSYNIVTMRNLVNLEKKTETQLKEFRKHFDVPLAIKGVFTQKDIELVKQVKPEIIYISNHGGRVETEIGSTAEFLAKHGKELKSYCKEIWVDGGIRSCQDIQTAIYYGADQVIMARPIIRAVFDNEDINF